MTTTIDRARSRFLLEVTLDQERIKQRIARLLREHRENQRPKPSQLQVSLELGDVVSYRQYQRWEGAESMPEWKQLEAISDYLGIGVDALLDDDEADTLPSEVTRLREVPLAGGDAAPDEVVAVLERMAGLLESLDRRVGRIERRLGRVEKALGAQRRPDVQPARRAAVSNGES